MAKLRYENQKLYITDLSNDDLWVVNVDFGRCMLSKYSGYGNTTIDVIPLPLSTDKLFLLTQYNNVVTIKLTVRQKGCITRYIEYINFDFDNDYFYIKEHEVFLHGVGSKSRIEIFTSLTNLTTNTVIDASFSTEYKDKSFDIKLVNENGKYYLDFSSLNNKDFSNELIIVKSDDLTVREEVIVSQFVYAEEQVEHLSVVPSTAVITQQEKDEITYKTFKIDSYPRDFNVNITNPNVNIISIDKSSNTLTCSFSNLTEIVNNSVFGTVSNQASDMGKINAVQLKLTVKEKIIEKDTFVICGISPIKSKLLYNSNNELLGIETKRVNVYDSNNGIDECSIIFKMNLDDSNPREYINTSNIKLSDKSFTTQYDNPIYLQIKSLRGEEEYPWNVKDYDENILTCRVLPHIYNDTSNDENHGTEPQNNYTLVISLKSYEKFDNQDVIITNGEKDIKIHCKLENIDDKYKDRYVFVESSTNKDESRVKTVLDYEYDSFNSSSIKKMDSYHFTVKGQLNCDYTATSNGYIIKYKVLKLTNGKKTVVDLSNYVFKHGEKIYFGNVPDNIDENITYIFSNNPYIPKSVMIAQKSNKYYEKLEFRQIGSNKTYSFEVQHIYIPDKWVLEFVGNKKFEVETSVASEQKSVVIPSFMAYSIQGGIKRKEEVTIEWSNKSDGEIPVFNSMPFAVGNFGDNYICSNFEVITNPNPYKRERKNTLYFSLTNHPMSQIVWIITQGEHRDWKFVFINQYGEEVTTYGMDFGSDAEKDREAKFISTVNGVGEYKEGTEIKFTELGKKTLFFSDKDGANTTTKKTVTIKGDASEDLVFIKSLDEGGKSNSNINILEDTPEWLTINDIEETTSKGVFKLPFKLTTNTTNKERKFVVKIDSDSSLWYHMTYDNDGILKISVDPYKEKNTRSAQIEVTQVNSGKKIYLNIDQVGEEDPNVNFYFTENGGRSIVIKVPKSGGDKTVKIMSRDEKGGVNTNITPSKNKPSWVTGSVAKKNKNNTLDYVFKISPISSTETSQQRKCDFFLKNSDEDKLENKLFVTIIQG